MAWIMDTYLMGKGHYVPGIVTVKPISLDGSLGKEKMTFPPKTSPVFKLKSKQIVLSVYIIVALYYRKDF